MVVLADLGRPLTARETECLSWAAAGKTAAEISVIVGLAISTVNQHLAASRQKLGAVNTAQAAVLYDRSARQAQPEKAS